MNNPIQDCLVGIIENKVEGCLLCDKKMVTPDGLGCREFGEWFYEKCEIGARSSFLPQVCLKCRFYKTMFMSQYQCLDGVDESCLIVDDSTSTGKCALCNYFEGYNTIKMNDITPGLTCIKA
jgi:hypothetical protein